MVKERYTLKGKVWLYPGENAAWHFVSVDKKTSETLRAKYSKKARGFGSLRVTATIGNTTWETSIFPDKRSGCYLLPLKMKVRHAEAVGDGDLVRVALTVKS